MFLHGCGAQDDRVAGEETRRRASLRLAVIRVEVLEDRFLLSGGSTVGLIAHEVPLFRGVRAIVDNSRQRREVVSPMIDLITSPGAHRSIHGASVNSAHMKATHHSINENPAAGLLCDGLHGEGSAGLVHNVPPVHYSPADGGSTVPAPITVYAPATQPDTASSEPASPTGPSWGGSVGTSIAVALPSPMPVGVPAGGIFKAPADHLGGTTGSLLSIDAVAADPSSIGVVPAGAEATFVGGAGFTQASILSPSPGSASARGAPSRALAPTVSQARFDSADNTAQERAILPDVTAYWPAIQPASARLKLTRTPLRGAVLPADLLVDDVHQPAGTEPALAMPTVLRAVNNDTAKTARNDRPLAAGLAIYGAACMAVGVAAPALTPRMHRRKRRSR
jgi:hypothetical protein